MLEHDWQTVFTSCLCFWESWSSHVGDEVLWIACWPKPGVLGESTQSGCSLLVLVSSHEPSRTEAGAELWWRAPWGLCPILHVSFAGNWSVYSVSPVQGFSQWMECHLLPRHGPILRIIKIMRPTERSMKAETCQRLQKLSMLSPTPATVSTPSISHSKC